MKISILSIRALACAAAVALSVSAQAAFIYHNDFSDETYYNVGSSVIGLDGWTKLTISSGNNNDARIEAPGWSSDGKALLLKSSQVNPATVSVMRTLETPTTDRKVQLDAVMAFNTAVTSNSNINSRMFVNNGDATSGVNVSPFVFGFNMASSDTGLYVVGLGEVSTTILARDKVVKDSPYTFSVLLDFDLKVFNISVSGMQKNDLGGTESFSWTSETPIAFRKGNTGLYSDSIISFTMAQNSYYLSGYLDEITIQSIPEPSTVVALFGGSVMLLALRFRKRGGN